MPSVKFKNQLHLHFLVFIAGFTSILGELISLEAIPLVWYRMLIAGVLMFGFIKIKKISLVVPFRTILKFFLAGIVIALHWITFFAAIKVSNISITLAMIRMRFGKHICLPLSLHPCTDKRHTALGTPTP